MFITLHGAQGSTHKVRLPASGPEQYQRGQEDRFTLDLQYIGALEKLTVSHDGTGQEANWFLESVDVADVKTGAAYHFPWRK